MPFIRTRVLAAVAVLLLLAPGVGAVPDGGDAAEGTSRGGSWVDGDRGSSSRATAKWTYLVYMSADNNLEDEAILNVNQMEEVGSSVDLSIVIQLDRHPEYDETNGDWNTTRRYLIEEDHDPVQIDSLLLEDMGEVDMGDERELRDFIVWGVRSYPAERYYLDVWGHGGGWRDGTCNDYSSAPMSVISIRELGEALSEARTATNVTLDGVGFDQCLMAQLEVYYEIKALGDVFVGAETLIPSEGYNYTRHLSRLASDPDMDVAELSEIMVESFFDEYGHDNERAHSSVDAEALDAALVPAVNNLAQVLRGVADTLHDEIKWARDYAQTYKIIDYIDLGNFTERLLQSLPADADDARAAASEVRDAVNLTVLTEDHGTGRKGSTGLSFYFPEWGSAWSYGQLTFGIEQRWDELLSAYFDRRDHPNEPPTIEVSEPFDGSVVGLNVGLSGTASDIDGNVTRVEWKFDRGRWDGFKAGSAWSSEVSTEGLAPGLHRLSLRARDDKGDYSREVHLTVNVESRCLELEVVPARTRTYPGGSVSVDLNLSASGDEGGTARLELHSAPVGWTVDLPFSEAVLPQWGHYGGNVVLEVPSGAVKGTFDLVLRAYMVDAPLIQAFAAVEVNVTEPWPDLVVGPILFSPAEPLEGENVIVTASVRNTGLIPAGPFDLVLTHELEEMGSSTRELSGEVIELVHVPSLEVGGISFVQTTWRATLGSHMFSAIADPEGNLSDLNPMDNVDSRELLLLGYGVDLWSDVLELETTPGAMERINLTVRNAGNLFDVITLEVLNNTLNWSAVLNVSALSIQPKGLATAHLNVTVPLSVPGGEVTMIRLRAHSLMDESKMAEIVVKLVVPEAFLLGASTDLDGATIMPLGTVSFNITIENGGNGYENYTLEYEHRPDHLLVTAVNDTLEVAPGCSTDVEVFVSAIGTNVGGKEFSLGFVVRSVDDASTHVELSFLVTVGRVFGVGVYVMGGPIAAVPGELLDLNLSLENVGNYPVTLVVGVLGPAVVFGEGPELVDLLRQEVGPGNMSEVELFLPVLPQVPMGQYTMRIRVHEAGVVGNATEREVPVEVEAVHGLVLRSMGSSGDLLAPGGTWVADLEVENLGNHPETVWLNVTGVPGWMETTFSRREVELAAYSSYGFTLTLSIVPDSDGENGAYAIVVIAVSGNLTAEPPSVTHAVEVDFGDEPGGPVWIAYLTFALMLIVLLVMVAIFVRGK